MITVPIDGKRIWLLGAAILVCVAVLYLGVLSLGISSSSEVSVEFDGEFQMDNQTFSMRGAIRKVPESETGIENVSVYFYRENGTHLATREVGGINTAINFSIATGSPPRYVIIDSPEFWSRSNVEVLSYYRSAIVDGQPDYSSEWVNSRDEFPEGHTP